MKGHSVIRDTAVKCAVKMGVYPKIVSFLNRWIAKREAAIIKKHGVEALAKLDEVLTKNGMKPFFAFGLLLGAYRDKGFIPYDYDLDTGIVEERPENMLDLMRENGFRLVRQFYFKEDGRISVEQFEYNKVPIDVYYFFDHDDDNIGIVLPLKHEYKDWKEANETDGFPGELVLAEKTTFSRQDFMGIQFYMPDKAESWLSGFYGADFMTPMKNWTAGERQTKRWPYPLRQYRNLEIVRQQAEL